MGRLQASVEVTLLLLNSCIELYLFSICIHWLHFVLNFSFSWTTGLYGRNSMRRQANGGITESYLLRPVRQAERQINRQKDRQVGSTHSVVAISERRRFGCLYAEHIHTAAAAVIWEGLSHFQPGHLGVSVCVCVCQGARHSCSNIRWLVAASCKFSGTFLSSSLPLLLHHNWIKYHMVVRQSQRFWFDSPRNSTKINKLAWLASGPFFWSIAPLHDQK